MGKHTVWDGIIVLWANKGMSDMQLGRRVNKRARADALVRLVNVNLTKNRHATLRGRA